MTEEEEFEFRNRLESEQGAATPPPPKGNYVTDSLKNVALGGLRGGPFGALMAGAAEGAKGLDRAGELAGGFATDQLAKVAPAEVAAGVGTAVQMAPSVLVGGTGAAKAGKEAMEAGAKSVMQQALRPTSKSLANGDAARAIDTMLEEGISATKGGGAVLRQKITELKAEVGKLISAHPGTLVDKSHVFKELAETLDEVSHLGRPDAAREAVAKAWDAFKNHPLVSGANTKIPLELADKMKRTTQRSVKDAYGRMTTTPVDDKVDMAIATGLRKGIEAEVPQIGGINAKLSQYINALHQIDPRAAQFANLHIGGLAPLANSPEAAMIMLADRNPWLKSYVARVLHSGRQTIPGAAGAAAGGIASETYK